MRVSEREDGDIYPLHHISIQAWMNKSDPVIPSSQFLIDQTCTTLTLQLILHSNTINYTLFIKHSMCNFCKMISVSNSSSLHWIFKWQFSQTETYGWRKMKIFICWKCPHPQATRDIDEFVFLIRTDLEKCSNTITCSPMDPLEWMGAVRMRVQNSW